MIGSRSIPERSPRPGPVHRHRRLHTVSRNQRVSGRRTAENTVRFLGHVQDRRPSPPSACRPTTALRSPATNPRMNWHVAASNGVRSSRGRHISTGKASRFNERRWTSCMPRSTSTTSIISNCSMKSRTGKTSTIGTDSTAPSAHHRCTSCSISSHLFRATERSPPSTTRKPRSSISTCYSSNGTDNTYHTVETVYPRITPLTND